MFGFYRGATAKRKSSRGDVSNCNNDSRFQSEDGAFWICRRRLGCSTEPWKPMAAQLTDIYVTFNCKCKVMRPSSKVVTRGLFLVVEAPQDMVRFAGNWYEQLVVGSNSQGLNRQKICRQVATPRQSSHEPLHPRLILSGCKPHQAGKAYNSEATLNSSWNILESLHPAFTINTTKYI